MGKSARWIKKILGLKKKSSKDKTPGKNPENNQILAKPPLPLNEAARIQAQLPPAPALPPKGESPLPAPPPAAKLQDRQIQCTDDVPVEDFKHTEYDAGDEDVFPKISSQEDLAAVKIQKAFRCYLSRRALRALRSVIRLQALARGHAVRRQAAAALRCVQAIVRVQAIFRGRQVRLSEEGQAIQYLLQRYRQETDSWQSADQGPHQQMYRVNSANVKETDKALASALQRQVDWSKTKKQPPFIDSALESGSGWGWLQRWTSARPWALNSIEASSEAGVEHPRSEAELKAAEPHQPELKPADRQEEETPRLLETHQPEVRVPEKQNIDDEDTPNMEDYYPEVNEFEKSNDHGTGGEQPELEFQPELEKKANGHHDQLPEVVEEEDDEYHEAFDPHQEHQPELMHEPEEHQEEFEDDDDDDDEPNLKESGHDGSVDDEHLKEDENPINNNINNNNNNNGDLTHHLLNLQPPQKVPSYMAATQSAKAKARAQSPKSTSPSVKRRFSVTGKASLESSPSAGSATTTPRRLSLPTNNNNVEPGSVSPRRLSISNGVSSRSPQTRSSGKSKAQESGVRRSSELRKSFRF